VVIERTTILIDDDPLVRLTWKISAERRRVSLQTFASLEEFQNFKSQVDLASPIYIDSQLQNGIRGEEVARVLFQEGFSELWLATGYDSAQFEGYQQYLKGIVGKDPPW